MEEEEEMKWKREERGGEREREIKSSLILTLTYNTHTHTYTKYGIYILSLFNAGHDFMLGRLESFILRGVISLILKVTESQYQYSVHRVQSHWRTLLILHSIHVQEARHTHSLLSMIYT